MIEPGRSTATIFRVTVEVANIDEATANPIQAAATISIAGA
jgi:hypothetical protein